VALFTSFQRFLSVFAFGDVPVYNIDGRFVIFCGDRLGQYGDIHQRSVFFSSLAFHLEAVTAHCPGRKRQAFRFQLIRHDQGLDPPADAGLFRILEKPAEFFIHPDHPVLQVEDDNGFRGDFNQLFRIPFLVVKLFFSQSALGDRHG
jgi:hypothetical protein